MCVRILRRDIERIGSNFSILDSTDQLSVIRNVMKRHIDPKKFEPKAIQAAMSAAKNELISPTV